MNAILIYALMWAIFGLGHSLLARESVKRSLYFIPGHRFRLYYNVFSSIHTIIVLLTGLYLFRNHPPVINNVVVIYVLKSCSLAGLALALVALREYDLSSFSGTAQWRQGEAGKPVSDHEARLQTNGLHAWIRHPLYTAAFLLLWGQVSTWFGLTTAIFGSCYLLIGTRFEERALVRQFGQQYIEYQQRVPRFVPGIHFIFTGARNRNR